MPQLDFFTVTAQLICLLLSILLIYSFLLKYALPAYDVLLRLKVKKVVYYRLGVENLIFLSLLFKKNAIKYVLFFNLCIEDLSKIYFNFLSTVFPILYFLSLKNNIKEVETPLFSSVVNMLRFVGRDTYLLSRNEINMSHIKNISGF